MKADFFQMLRTLLIFSLPFTGLLYYTNLHIETALLRRDIRQATIEQQRLMRENAALKGAIAELGPTGYESHFWKLYGALPHYEDNEVVRIQLPENL